MINYEQAIPAKHLERLRSFAMLTSHQGVYHTFLTACRLISAKVPGCFVECGVAGGAQLAAMCYAMDVMGERRLIHGFDSFEGIPLAGPEDDQQPGKPKIDHDVNLPIEQRLVSSGVAAFSLETTRANLAKFGYGEYPILLHKGWFQKTLYQVMTDDIAMLRLDGDLYESTLTALQALYYYVTFGGTVIVDDYGTLSGCRKAVEAFFKEANIGPTMHQVTDYGAHEYSRRSWNDHVGRPQLR